MLATRMLIAAHVICTTLGHAGLVCCNVWIAVLARPQAAGISGETVRTSLLMNRVFGPLLGAGIVFGFVVAAASRISPFAPWLVLTYAAIALALALQAAIGIPWHLRTLRAISEANVPAVAVDTRAPVLVAGGFVAAYVTIVLLMVVRPNAF
jgi:hypothetical protein